MGGSSRKLALYRDLGFYGGFLYKRGESVIFLYDLGGTVIK
jgi:hypothetical protein